MSKRTTLFDFGIILRWAEQGLSKASLTLENRVDRLLGRMHKKDKKKEVVKRKEKVQNWENIRLEKSQENQLERLEELENAQQEMSNEAEIDKD